jgi:hypothetical protein
MIFIIFLFCYIYINEKKLIILQKKFNRFNSYQMFIFCLKKVNLVRLHLILNKKKEKRQKNFFSL